MAKLEFVKNREEPSKYMTATEIMKLNEAASMAYAVHIAARQEGKTEYARIMEELLNRIFDNLSLTSHNLIRSDNG